MNRRAALILRSSWAVPAALFFWLLLWLLHAHRTFDFTPIPNGEGFLGRANLSIFSADFYFAVRPFVTSLMYKIYGAKGAALMECQVQFSALCWVFLTWVMSLFIERPLFRWLHVLGFPTIIGWWAILGWNFAERSESTALSFLALWLGTLLLYLRRRTIARAVVLGGVSLLFNFTRDNVPLIVLPTVFLLLTCDGWSYLRAKERTLELRRRGILAASLAVFLFLGASFQLATIQTVEHRFTKSRHEFPLANIVIRRVLPDVERREWFHDEGMPVHLEILRWRKRWASGEDFAIFRKKRYEEFRLWLRYEGKYTYAKYLITHPGYVATSVMAARADLFSDEFRVYTGAPQEDSPLVRVANASFPFFTPSLALLLSLTALGISLFRRVERSPRGEPALQIVASITLLTFVNTAAVFHMDAMEVPRHSSMALPLIQVVSYCLTLLLLGRRNPAS